MKRYRNEWKYICAEEQLRMLEERLNGILELDENSGEQQIYQVNSLYFDDYDDSCFMDNDIGVNKRYKYRIRYYNDDSGQLKLERKDKCNGFCSKVSCPLPVPLYQQMIEGNAMDVFWQSEEPLIREFCIQMTERRFEPKVIVAYERTAYVSLAGNVRITLDRNIRGASEVETFLRGDGMFINVQKDKLHLLEVKFDDVLPDYIKQLVYRDEMLRTTFSKYYLTRQATMNGA